MIRAIWEFFFYFSFFFFKEREKSLQIGRLSLPLSLVLTPMRHALSSSSLSSFFFLSFLASSRHCLAETVVPFHRLLTHAPPAGPPLAKLQKPKSLPPEAVHFVSNDVCGRQGSYDFLDFFGGSSRWIAMIPLPINCL